MRLRYLANHVLLAAAIVGCSEKGESRFRLQGTATFDGKPIAYGDVLFTPDGSKGNKGPQGIAQIRDGKFDTGAEGGKGIAGGPTIIRLTGMTGQAGKTVCEYEWPMDLPKADGKQDLDVPKKAGVNSKANPEI